MKKFLVLYRSPISARSQMANATPEQAKAGMDAWMGWFQKNSATVVDLGSPLGEGTVVAQASGAGKKGDESIAGFSIVQGDTLQAVAAKFADHPHHMMPGSTIEIFEFLAMPGM